MAFALLYACLQKLCYIIILQSAKNLGDAVSVPYHTIILVFIIFIVIFLIRSADHGLWIRCCYHRFWWKLKIMTLHKASMVKDPFTSLPDQYPHPLLHFHPPPPIFLFVVVVVCFYDPWCATISLNWTLGRMLHAYKGVQLLHCFQVFRNFKKSSPHPFPHSTPHLFHWNCSKCQWQSKQSKALWLNVKHNGEQQV